MIITAMTECVKQVVFDAHCPRRINEHTLRLDTTMVAVIGNKAWLSLGDVRHNLEQLEWLVPTLTAIKKGLCIWR